MADRGLKDARHTTPKRLAGAISGWGRRWHRICISVFGKTNDARERKSSMKTLIVYSSQTGNTKKIAEEISKGIEKLTDVKSNIKSTSEITKKDFELCDGIIAGSPVYFGTMAAELKEIFDKYHKTFYKDLHGWRDYELTSRGYGEWYYDFLPNDKQAKILDIGCAGGGFLKFLQQKENKWLCYGTDIIKSSYDDDNIDIKYGYLPELNYPHSFFDIVCTCSITPHAHKPDEYFTNTFEIFIGFMRMGSDGACT